MKRAHLLTTASPLLGTPAFAQQATTRWTGQKTNAWYGQQVRLAGANFVPYDAINKQEMFQDSTFHPGLTNDTPSTEREVDLIRELTARGAPLTTSIEGP